MFTVKVRDVMTAPAISVRDTAPLKDVVDCMLRHDISALPVVDEHGALVGLISDADLITKPAQGGGRRLGHTAGEIMSAPVDSARLDDTVREVAGRMIDDRRKHLPVIDGSRRLVGIVSRRDLLRMFDRPDAELAADVADALAEDPALDGHDVSVTARDGVVRIEGTVSGIDDVTRVRRLAWMVPCVVDVVSYLTVAEGRLAADAELPTTRGIVDLGAVADRVGREERFPVAAVPAD
jgi:CBS domain-containing protein